MQGHEKEINSIRFPEEQVKMSKWQTILLSLDGIMNTAMSTSGHHSENGSDPITPSAEINDSPDTGSWTTCSNYWPH